MRTQGNGIVIVFIAVSLSLLPPARVYAGGEWWQGKIRERIKQRRLDRGRFRPASRAETYFLAHDGLKRTYRVHLPPSYDGRTPTPVVIYLHGGGGSTQAAFRDGVDKYSDKFGFLLVVPAGTGILEDKLLAWNAGGWNARSGNVEKCCGYAAENNVDDVGFIKKMIDEIKRNFNVDETRIYSTGISNGGIMSYTLACELSDKIAAVASVAPPGTPKECSALRPIPVMHIHGTADPCAPYEGGRAAGCLGSKRYEMQSASEIMDVWKNINGCLPDSQSSYAKGNASCMTYRGCEDGADVEFCTIQGMGHTYPSGVQYLSADKIGPVSHDISFDQIWEFFKKHPLLNSVK
jgi:polyhydroxybutyrate depolymerase